MVAEVVATPVLERLRAGAGAGVVRGATGRAAYLDLGGFVVALTAPGRAADAERHRGPAHGCRRRRGSGGAGRDPAVRRRGPVVGRGRRDGIRRCGGPRPTTRPRCGRAPRRCSTRSALSAADAGAAPAFAAFGLSAAGAGAAPGPAALGASAGSERARTGLAHLHRAVADRDDRAAARAAERLLGLGGGLTPEGDDVLAATAAVVAAAGDAAGFAAPDRARWLAALVPDDVAARTTALSATLLALAREGGIVEPVHRLLDPAAGDAAWRAALATLSATGASTGRAYAAAAATALALLLGRA